MPPLRQWERFDNRAMLVLASALGVLALVIIWYLISGPRHQHPELANRLPRRSSLDNVIELDEQQARSLRLSIVSEQDFHKAVRSYGGIDFDQNRTVTIYAHYPGRILEAQPNVGDYVQKDQFLFSMQSPDLLAAETTLIANASANVLQGKNLRRAQEMIKIGGISEMALDQAVSGQQTAQGAIVAARNTLKTFGKTDEEIDALITERRADAALVVKSPIAGVIVARAAAPGLYVQPGSAPAPYIISDTSTLWLYANVVEEDAPLIHVGQKIEAQVAAFPEAIFYGKISVIGAALDPVTRRLAARCEIADPGHLLRAGMFADVSIWIGDVYRAPATPASAIYREGDGQLTVWTTKDDRRFTRKYVKIGAGQDGFSQIISGLKIGDKVVSDGGLILTKRDQAITLHHYR
jgi:cobalt-zinc-cadmium efflux system membrane fusion protein